MRLGGRRMGEGGCVEAWGRGREVEGGCSVVRGDSEVVGGGVGGGGRGGGVGVFFFNGTAATEVYALSLRGALPFFYCAGTSLRRNMVS